MWRTLCGSCWSGDSPPLPCSVFIEEMGLRVVQRRRAGGRRRRPAARTAIEKADELRRCHGEERRGDKKGIRHGKPVVQRVDAAAEREKLQHEGNGQKRVADREGRARTL